MALGGAAMSTDRAWVSRNRMAGKVQRSLYKIELKGMMGNSLLTPRFAMQAGKGDLHSKSQRG